MLEFMHNQTTIRIRKKENLDLFQIFARTLLFWEHTHIHHARWPG